MERQNGPDVVVRINLPVNDRDMAVRLNGPDTVVRIHLPMNSLDTQARLNGSCIL